MGTPQSYGESSQSSANIAHTRSLKHKRKRQKRRSFSTLNMSDEIYDQQKSLERIKQLSNKSGRASPAPAASPSNTISESSYSKRSHSSISSGHISKREILKVLGDFVYSKDLSFTNVDEVEAAVTRSKAHREIFLGAKPEVQLELIEELGFEVRKKSKGSSQDTKVVSESFAFKQNN